MAFSPSLKQNFIAYRSSKVSSRPDCIFEINQLWQSGFCRVYSNCCCSCSFEPEIIKFGQSSHKMYSNNIVNFQESTPILNACTKKSGNLLNVPRMIFIYVNKVNSFQVLLCISNNSMKHQSFVYTQLNDQTVLYLTIQFSISHLLALSLMSNSSTWTIDGILSGATILGYSGLRSDGNEGVLCIPQSSRCTGVSLSDCLNVISRTLHTWWGSYPSA